MSAAVEEGDRVAAAATARRRRQSGALTHGILLLGVFAVVFPIWIALVGSTHDASTVGRGDVPLLPGAEAVENYATALTGGGPGKATETLIYKAYVEGVQNTNLGSSAAQSVILMLIVVALTMAQFRFVERRVHY